MLIGTLLFIGKRKYDLRAALGLAVVGVPGVLVGSFIIKSLSLWVLNWLVFVIVLYTAATLLVAASRTTRAAGDQAKASPSVALPLSLTRPGSRAPTGPGHPRKSCCA
jgi:uncharacterized membrane protein YfcA